MSDRIRLAAYPARSSLVTVLKLSDTLKRQFKPPRHALLVLHFVVVYAVRR